MGLDMYLSVREYVNRIDWREITSIEDRKETTQFRDVVNAVDMRSLIVPGESAGAYVEIPAMYWRKANAIHEWFVNELAEGVDDCHPIYLEPEKLAELVDLCEQVTKDHSKAEELLPTANGFFFGGTEYDEHYYQNIAYTADRLRYILKVMDAKHADTLVYQASW